MEILFDSKPDLLPRIFLRNQEQITQMMEHLPQLCSLRHCELRAVNNCKIQQFDIKGAYLHGTLHKTIFM
jgi:hypothetical protein